MKKVSSCLIRTRERRKVEMKLNEKLFNGIYEIYNMATDTIKDIVVADSEYEALPNGNENESACNFFDEPRTLDDLRMELKEGNIALDEVLKTPEQLFYMVFDKEDYEIKALYESKNNTQFALIDKTQGYELTFDIDTKNYMVFYVSASGIFFANKYTTELWHKFLELVDETHWVIVEYENE